MTTTLAFYDFLTLLLHGGGQRNVLEPAWLSFADSTDCGWPSRRRCAWGGCTT